MKFPKFLAIALVFVLGLASVGRAQDQPAQFIQVVTTTVKSEAVTEYEDFVKKIVAGANKIGAPQRVFGYQVILGGPGLTYNFVIPFSKWSELDTFPIPPEILAKAYGEAEAAKILKAGRASVAHSESAVYRLLRDLSTKPKLFDPPKAFTLVIRTEIKPETASGYELYLAKVKAAQEQAPDSPTAIRRVAVQGTASTYVTAIPFNKHSERDGWPSLDDLLSKAYGPAEARHLSESSLRSVSKREFVVVAYRPDLSRPAAGPAK